MSADETSWRTNNFRQSVVAKIEEAIRSSGMPTSKNSMEMENHVFQKAKTKEEYLSFVARLILHVREMNSKKNPGMGGPAGAGGQNMQDPINALQTLARQGTGNQMMGLVPPQGPTQVTATNYLDLLGTLRMCFPEDFSFEMQKEAPAVNHTSTIQNLTNEAVTGNVADQADHGSCIESKGSPVSKEDAFRPRLVTLYETHSGPPSNREKKTYLHIPKLNYLKLCSSLSPSLSEPSQNICLAQSQSNVDNSINSDRHDCSSNVYNIDDDIFCVYDSRNDEKGDGIENINNDIISICDFTKNDENNNHNDKIECTNSSKVESTNNSKTETRNSSIIESANSSRANDRYCFDVSKDDFNFFTDLMYVKSSLSENEESNFKKKIIDYAVDIIINPHKLSSDSENQLETPNFNNEHTLVHDNFDVVGFNEDIQNSLPSDVFELPDLDVQSNVEIPTVVRVEPKKSVTIVVLPNTPLSTESRKRLKTRKVKNAPIKEGNGIKRSRRIKFDGDSP